MGRLTLYYVYMNKKNYITEKTPSKSEYFSWISHTNEGSNEADTLKCLAFFKYLHDNYSMTLDIYAWDAGNLDGAGNSYESLDSPKIKKQYPNGYLPIVDYAKTIGTRMGVWGGADGYGDNIIDAQKRHDLLVKLCKEYNFALFKFDAVCGGLRKNKIPYFEKTINECRKYSKDLILLNHRNDLGKASYLSTTFLWEGLETYTDVHCYNKICAPHNRAYIFNRGYTPNLKRLTEDHGVCISSSIDYFEDDLIYQAFNRCLILAPEIYGNPWLMRDDELPIMAHIFNLHRYYRDVLVDAIIPYGIDLGDNPVVRGNNHHRFISTGNASWKTKVINVPLNESIGLFTNEKIAVIVKFPYEEFIGIYSYNDAVNIELLPFRASLIEITPLSELKAVLLNAKYQIIKEDENLNIKTVKILKTNGNVILFKDENKQVVLDKQVDDIEKSLIYIGDLTLSKRDNTEELYENIHFKLENDSLERRSLNGSGKSNIKEVNDCRESFFNQESYRLRGLDSFIPFDKNEDTIYDTKSISYYNHDNREGFRIEGGTLRIDLLKEYKFNKIKITYFDSCGLHPGMFKNIEPKDNLESSIDLKSWTKGKLDKIIKISDHVQPVFAYYCDSYMEVSGKKMEVTYNLLSSSARYIRLPEQMDRIYTIKFFNDDKEIDVFVPHLNNLYAPYYKRKTKYYLEKDIELNFDLKYPKLVVAVNGYTGYENASCGIIIDNTIYPAPRRAPEYPANAYEYPVHPVDSNYSFFIPIKDEWKNKTAKVFVLLGEDEKLAVLPSIKLYACDEHKERTGVTININD